ncbi:MAG: MerR family transcriptional regulator [Clostridiales bacterium]|jgi:DNA-binding transcriptional MerR regulator|nr:MerR family transcriptional regulator [Clostridiales bacterium]
MEKNRWLSVGDFAKLSRTTRDTLYHYDNLGLLSPMSRGENRYRYYSSRQLATVNVIRILQQLGMTLTEIKTLIKGRTPEQITEILANQVQNIDRAINGWVNARKLLLTLKGTIQSVSGVDEHAMAIQFLPAEAIIRGNLNDYSGGKTEYDNLHRFYNHMREGHPDLDLNYPVWGLFSEERVKRGDWNGPDRYYFYNPEGWDKRPAAFYAVGYTRGNYGQADELYNRLINYIAENNFEICGDAYEEYPLNEVSVSDDNYLVRLMITVREKPLPRARTAKRRL